MNFSEMHYNGANNHKNSKQYLFDFYNEETEKKTYRRQKNVNEVLMSRKLRRDKM